MPNQLAQHGTLEQILRAVKQLALSSALAEEVAVVAGRMGSNTFQPSPIVSYNGNQVPYQMNDQQFGDPTVWVGGKYGQFAQAFASAQLRPIPPYPLLQLLAAPGRPVTDANGVAMEIDQGTVSMDWHVFDAVIVTQADRPDPAARRALALCDALDRLISRNQNLGGLVYICRSVGPPSPGGEVESRRVGLLSGMVQRYEAAALTTTY